MAFRVEFRPRAEQDLETLFRRLIQEAPLRGPRWIDGLEEAIYSLRKMPERCLIVRQFSKPTVAVRLLLYGRYPHVYKIYFTIESNTVWILHIRHGARREPKRPELLG
jgi:plasmid stabilization system protein ParE